MQEPGKYWQLRPTEQQIESTLRISTFRHGQVRSASWLFDQLTAAMTSDVGMRRGTSREGGETGTRDIVSKEVLPTNISPAHAIRLFFLSVNLSAAARGGAMDFAGCAL